MKTGKARIVLSGIAVLLGCMMFPAVAQCVDSPQIAAMANPDNPFPKII